MSQPQPSPHILIRPEGLDLRTWLVDLWHYRDVLVSLAMRDVRLRYRQTALGVLWVVLQPLVAGLIFAVVFGHFARLPSGEQPYLLFVLAAILPWQLFASTVQRAGVSLVGESRLVTKVYFPRMLVPCAAAGSAVVDFCVSLLVLGGAMVASGVAPRLELFLLPVAALVALVFGLGLGIWLAALNARYRDFAHAMPFLIQIWLYASPVVYGSDVVPESWSLLFFANPMAGVIETARMAVVPGQEPHGLALLWSVVAAALLFTSGALVFRRMERDLCDKL